MPDEPTTITFRVTPEPDKARDVESRFALAVSSAEENVFRSMAEIAKMLGIGRSTLYRRLARLKKARP